MERLLAAMTSGGASQDVGTTGTAGTADNGTQINTPTSVNNGLLSSSSGSSTTSLVPYDPSYSTFQRTLTQMRMMNNHQYDISTSLFGRAEMLHGDPNLRLMSATLHNYLARPTIHDMPRNDLNVSDTSADSGSTFLMRKMMEYEATNSSIINLPTRSNQQPSMTDQRNAHTSTNNSFLVRKVMEYNDAIDKSIELPACSNQQHFMADQRHTLHPETSTVIRKLLEDNDALKKRDAIINSLAAKTVAAATANANNLDVLALAATRMLEQDTSPAAAAAAAAATTNPPSTRLNGNDENGTLVASRLTPESPNAVNQFPTYAKTVCTSNTFAYQNHNLNAPVIHHSQQGHTLSRPAKFQQAHTTAVKLPSKVDNIVSPPNGRACGGRKVGRIRRYDEQKRAYGAWEDIYVPNSSPNDGCMRIDLKRGGKVGLYTKMLPQEKRKSLSTAMHQCKLYRQYTRSQVFHEPRFHVLLSSKAHFDAGYKYHGIKMKAQPIDLVPEVASYARELARYYKLPQDQWDIGVDLIVYRDGDDSIGWHADDTQGESVVLCVVVDAPGDEPRPVHVRPNKRAKQLSDGDEEIQLNVGEGMAYDMDGLMQAGYEHSLPKKKDNKSHRFVLIFRHGNLAAVPKDSGTAICTGIESETLIPLLSRLRVKPPLVFFGHPQGVLEGSSYSRRFLYASNAHRADQRGVNGNIQLGSDSLVVSRQHPDKRESDGLQWLRYTSSRRQGGGAICLSRKRRLPLRVFRSSNLKSEYAPPELDGNRTSYRYDGLYIVTRTWDADGNSLDHDNVDIPVGGDQFTFHLERIPNKVEGGNVHNSLSVNELWNAIQHSHGLQRTQFIPSCPKCDVTLSKLANDVAVDTGIVTNQRKHDNIFSYPSTTMSPMKHTLTMATAKIQPTLMTATMKIQPSKLDGVAPTKAKEKMLDRWKRFQNEDRLASLPSPYLHDCNPLSPWLSVPSQSGGCVYNHLSRTLLQNHHRRPILPHGENMACSVTPYFQSNPLRHPSQNAPSISQHIANNTSHLPPTMPRSPSAANPPGLSVNPTVNLSGQSDTANKVDQEQQENQCDFNNPNAIMTTFGYRRGMGKLRPLLSEIAKHQTSEEKSQYIRKWRNMTREQQEQYKQDKREKREALEMAEKEKKKRDNERRLEELMKMRAVRAAKKVRITKLGERELEIFAHSFILVEHWRNSTQLTDKRKNKIRLKKEPALNSPPKRKTPAIATPKMGSRKSPAIATPKVESRRSTPKVEEPRSPMSPKHKRQRLQTSKPTNAIEQSRKITPRFTTIDENMQSLSPPLNALHCLGRRKFKEVKVTVKWAIPGKLQQRGIGICNADSQLDRKRKVGPVSAEAVEHTPYRKSPRLSHKVPHEKNHELEIKDVAVSKKSLTSETYSISEKIFAWDKGHLYEASILKCKDLKNGKEYQVHYLGFKSSHDRWMQARYMIKDTAESREFFDECKTWPLEEDPKVVEDIRKEGSKSHKVDVKNVTKSQRSPRIVQSGKGTVKEPRVGTRGSIRLKGIKLCGENVVTKVSQQQSKDKALHHAINKDRHDEKTKRPKKELMSAAKCVQASVRKSPRLLSKDVESRGHVLQARTIERLEQNKGALSQDASECKTKKRTAPGKAPKVQALGPKASAQRIRVPAHKVKIIQRPQTRAQDRITPARVPKVGMSVHVKFARGKMYSGKITKVKTAANASYNIKIHYDDGDTEDTAYPDPDIHLVMKI